LYPATKNQASDRWPELPKGVKEPLQRDLESLWPEIAMAQSDCYACHHDLKSKSWRQLRGYSGRPGRPQLQPWPFALASLGVPADMKAFEQRRHALTLALDGQPFGVPKDVAEAAMSLEQFAASMARSTGSMTREKAQAIFDKLLHIGSGSSYLDYDSARQVAWATRMVFPELYAAHPRAKEAEAVLRRLDDHLNLTLASDARKKWVDARHKLTEGFAKEAVFEAAVKNAEFLKSLQKINDQELAAGLARIADYDPALFKKEMQQLSRIVAAK
jgi:hypothetical protein